MFCINMNQFPVVDLFASELPELNPIEFSNMLRVKGVMMLMLLMVKHDCQINSGIKIHHEAPPNQTLSYDMMSCCLPHQSEALAHLAMTFD